MLFTENTRLLMGNNMFQIPAIPLERQIDPWFDNAQDKRRAYIFTLKNIVLIENSCISFAAQTPIADSCV